MAWNGDAGGRTSVGLGYIVDNITMACMTYDISSPSPDLAGQLAITRLAWLWCSEPGYAACVAGFFFPVPVIHAETDCFPAGRHRGPARGLVRPAMAGQGSGRPGLRYALPSARCTSAGWKGVYYVVSQSNPETKEVRS